MLRLRPTHQLGNRDGFQRCRDRCRVAVPLHRPGSTLQPLHHGVNVAGPRTCLSDTRLRHALHRHRSRLRTRGRLQVLLPGWHQVAGVWAVTPQRLASSAKVRVAVEFLQGWLAQAVRAKAAPGAVESARPQGLQGPLGPQQPQ